MKIRLHSKLKYFVGDCGHSGFIKIEALKRLLDEKGLDQIKDAKILRMEKCFGCMQYVELEDCPTI